MYSEQQQGEDDILFLVRGTELGSKLDEEEFWAAANPMRMEVNRRAYVDSMVTCLRSVKPDGWQFFRYYGSCLHDTMDVSGNADGIGSLSNKMKKENTRSDGGTILSELHASALVPYE